MYVCMCVCVCMHCLILTLYHPIVFLFHSILSPLDLSSLVTPFLIILLMFICTYLTFSLFFIPLYISSSSSYHVCVCTCLFPSLNISSYHICVYVFISSLVTPLPSLPLRPASARTPNTSSSTLSECCTTKSLPPPSSR